MASILIRQFAGQSVPPTSDAILYENATTGNGVIHGCNCTASDASTIHIDAGYGVIQGRFFEIEDQTISVTLAPSGTLLGQLYIHLDLSDADTPIDIYHEEAASLTSMTQQSGINYSNGIYEIQLCTFDVSTSTISNVVDTFPTLVSTATAISTLNSSMAKYTLLWTNSNPSANYAPTTLTIDISDYDYLFVISSHGTSFLTVGYSNSSVLGSAIGGGYIYVYNRTFNLSNTAQIAIAGGYYSAIGQSGTATQSNDICVPIKIYGVKM